MADRAFVRTILGRYLEVYHHRRNILARKEVFCLATVDAHCLDRGS